MAKGKTSRTSRVSSGNRARARAHQAMKRLEMKISRWKRYQLDEVKSTLRSWATEGLEKHHTLLKSLVTKVKK